MSNEMSRRKFLKTGAAAALGLAVVPSTVLGKKFGHTAPSDKLNILGVGIGGRGASVLKGLESQNIIGLCDVDWKYADHVFKRYPAAKKYNDYRKMYDELLKSADPVMVATSGARLISEDAIATLEARLLPLATVLTPNIPEAEVLSGLSITSPDDMIAAGKVISERYGCAVLCKGGHRLNDANDLLYRNGGYAWFNGKRIDNPNTHGTGCTLSSTIAANLAKGYDLDTAVRRAKAYLSGALAAMLDLGAGSGPMDHAFDLKPEYRQEAGR